MITVDTALAVGDDGGRVTALIDPASVETGSRQRDQHVRSADFLDVENYPQIELTGPGPAMTLVAPRRTYRKDRKHE
jgi:hypothetical protein